MDMEKIGAVVRQLVPVSRILGTLDKDVLDGITSRTVDQMGREELLAMARVAEAAGRALRGEAAQVLAGPPYRP